MFASVAYWVSVAIGAVICIALCVAARRRPGPWLTSAGRAISLVLAADAVVFVTLPLLALFDWLTDSNYMFLRARPRHSSLLSVLGPWPWYLVSTAAVALVVLLLLDAPFRRQART